MNHIFGPVNSRRLGRSLGIDLLPKKICNFNCIYCEVGATTLSGCERKEYVPTRDIIREIEEFCSNPGNLERVDVVTVTASGEPTLHAGLGEIIDYLKQRTGKPVAVLTNGTNLNRPDVAADLGRADLVIPSLDTVLPGSFQKINRPAPCVDLSEMIEGLLSFSHSFGGELWLEVLVVRGINDSPEEVEALSRVIGRMKVARVQLNTVARPPLEKYARAVSRERLAEIATLLSMIPGVPRVEIITHGISVFENGRDIGAAKIKFSYLRQEKLIEEILHMLQRRPSTAVDIDRIFNLGGPEKVEQLLEPLVRSGRIDQQLHEDHVFYLHPAVSGQDARKSHQ